MFITSQYFLQKHMKSASISVVNRDGVLAQILFPFYYIQGNPLVSPCANISNSATP